MSWIIRNQSSTWAEGGDDVYDIEISGVVYRVHRFTTVGTNELVVMNGGEVEYIVVGGGAGGSYNFALDGGPGGGAGGYRSSVEGERSGRDTDPEPKLIVTPQSYTVVVGDQNQDSILGPITALRGNIGAGKGGLGAAGGAGTAGQGFQGGAGVVSGSYRGAGGGGGAGSAGSTGYFNQGSAAGGAGIISNITGTAITYAKGGASIGARTFFTFAGGSGAPNTGSGGNGGFPPGTGGSGIVVVRYKI